MCLFLNWKNPSSSSGENDCFEAAVIVLVIVVDIVAIRVLRAHVVGMLWFMPLT